MDFAVSSPGPSLFLLPLLMLAVPLVLWIGFATRRDAVDRPNRIAHWYGYSVCLVAVVVLMMTLTAMVNHLFTRSSSRIWLQRMIRRAPALSSGPMDSGFALRGKV